MQYVPTVCAHCSNGCKTTLGVRNHEILRANNRDLSGLNKDFLCAKGRFGFDYTRHPDRLRQPLVRRNGQLQPASWEDALEETGSRIAAIHAQNGPDAIGFYGSNRTTNEENYLLARIARAAIGTNNVDHHRTADYAGMISALASGTDQAGVSREQSFATMGDLGSAAAFLLIGNDASEQNPLVAWQIRTAIRNFGARLYVIGSQDIKLRRKAKRFLQVSAGDEAAAIAGLATKDADAGPNACITPELQSLREELSRESELVVLFGADLQGADLDCLAKLRDSRAEQGKRTLFMALGDYANSRGASDMGLMPDRLPGYASVANADLRAAFGKLWGASLPEKAGLDAHSMLNAAVSGQLKALYVVGANPAKSMNIAGSARLGKLEFLVVHDLYVSETARLADIVLPALSAYEKDGTVTNTAGEIQLVRKAGEFMGARSDFDILRILSHQLARHGLGQPIRLRTPEAAFEEIREHVQGYGVSFSSLLAGSAEMSAAFAESNGHAPAGLPEGAVYSNNDSLFTSGTLSRYCRMIQSLQEADAKP